MNNDMAKIEDSTSDIKWIKNESKAIEKRK